MTLGSEPDAAAGAPGVKGWKCPRGSAVADPTAREFLRRADPVLRELIDGRPDFRPRAWLDELPLLDARRAYGFDHLPTEDEMVQVAEPWRPYRSLAVSYLFASEFEKGT